MQPLVAKEFVMQQTPSTNAVEVAPATSADRNPQLAVRKADMTDAATEPTAERDAHFPLGAHIVTPRLWYTHHGIYVGAGKVVHYQGLASSLRSGPVAMVSLAEFTHGHPVRAQGEVDMAYSGIEVVARACSRLGEDAYDVLRNNCEHFCSWCLTGSARSPQVERLLSNPRAVALAAQVLAGLVHGWSTACGALHGLPFFN
jgi:hypothetical protein